MPEHESVGPKAFWDLNPCVDRNLRSRVDYVISFKGNVIAIFRAFWKAVGRFGPVRWRVIAVASSQRFLLRELKRAKKIDFLSRGSFSRTLRAFF